MPELLSVKELAAAMKRSVTYVYAMRASGFVMPGGRTTVESAMNWLRANPDFRVSKPYKSIPPKKATTEHKKGRIIVLK